jgi:hypothetical protein
MASLPKPAVCSKLEAFLDLHKFNLRNLLKLTEDAFQELLQDEEFEYLTDARKQILIRDWGVQKTASLDRIIISIKNGDDTDEDKDRNAISIKREGANEDGDRKASAVARLPQRSKSEEGSDEDQDHNAILIKCEEASDDEDVDRKPSAVIAANGNNIHGGCGHVDEESEDNSAQEAKKLRTGQCLSRQYASVDPSEQPLESAIDNEQAVAEHGKEWVHVAKKVSGRSSEHHVAPIITKRWGAEEAAQLVRAVKKQNTDWSQKWTEGQYQTDWEQISAIVPSRPARCRIDWEQISAMVPDRSATQCRDRWSNMRRKRPRSKSS